MSETGSLKFAYDHAAVEPVSFGGMAELNACRRKLLQLRLLGVSPDGIGFGNLSVRDSGSDSFFITGSGTGALAQLGPEHYTRVTAYHFGRNWLRCEGATVASSESLTHAAVYETDADVTAVIHCHSAALWKRLLGLVPATRPEIEYGTPGMAHEVRRLFRTTDVRDRKIFVMAGHEEGLVVFGTSLNEAFDVLMSYAPAVLSS